MTEKGVDFFKIAEVSRAPQTSKVVINLKSSGFWEVRLCDVKGDIDSSFPQLYLTEAKEYILSLSSSKRYYFLFTSSDFEFIISETTLPLEGASNFRDLGGLSTVDGRHIKWGKIYRSDELSQLTDSDLVYLDTLQIKSVLDYRSRHEVRKCTDRALSSVQFYYSIPISSGAVKSSANPNNSNVDTLVAQMQNMYREYIKDSDCLNSFRQMFKIVQYDLSTPTLFHCSAGKDRTGITIALFLFALGVSEEQIIKNYMVSKCHTPLKYREIVEKYPRMEPIFTVEKSYIMSSFKEIKRLYGSIDFFLEKVLMVNKPLLREIYLTPQSV